MKMPRVKFGKTGAMVSRLGFGAMRLPMKKRDDGGWDGVEESAELIRRGFQLGINYVDTAYIYKHSEYAVGKALKGWRDKVYVSTKIPMDRTPPELASSGGFWRERLEVQLERLEVNYIDFLHFHNLHWKHYTGRATNENGPLEAARKAKDEGLIKHISFSSHDLLENIVRLIDTGEFESTTLLYNLLDRRCEEAVAHAAERGLGVAIMEPIAGGRLAAASKVIPGATGPSAAARLALRFVLSNPNVHVVLSGMNAREQVEENVETVSSISPMTAEEKRAIDRLLERSKKQLDLPCTWCGYCLPCPRGVAIPAIFNAYNQAEVFGLVDAARKQYASLGTGPFKQAKPASECVECGQCEEKCPQKIPIIKKLKEAHKALTATRRAKRKQTKKKKH